MIYIVLGIIGFFLIFLSDLFSLKRLSFIKPASWALGTALVIYATTMTVVSGDTISLPLWITVGGWVLLLVAFTLTVFSLYINLPFIRTYLTAQDKERELVSNGLYTLVRHPWLLSFVLLLSSLFAVSGSQLLVVTVVTWIPINLILISFQDKYIFPRLFPGYDRYRKTTPMLVPSRKSIGAFIDQFNGKNKQGGKNEQVSRIIQTR